LYPQPSESRQGVASKLHRHDWNRNGFNAVIAARMGPLEGKHRNDQDNSRCPGENARSANGLGFRRNPDASLVVIVAGSLGVGFS
jgi:hypothetical protein